MCRSLSESYPVGLHLSKNEVSFPFLIFKHHSRYSESKDVHLVLREEGCWAQRRAGESRRLRAVDSSSGCRGAAGRKASLPEFQGQNSARASGIAVPCRRHWWLLLPVCTTHTQSRQPESLEIHSQASWLPQVPVIQGITHSVRDY